MQGHHSLASPVRGVLNLRGISHPRLHGTASKGLVGHLICSITASPNLKGNGGKASGVCVHVCMYDPRMGIGYTMMEKGKIDG